MVVDPVPGERAGAGELDPWPSCPPRVSERVVQASGAEIWTKGPGLAHLAAGGARRCAATRGLGEVHLGVGLKGGRSQLGQRGWPGTSPPACSRRATSSSRSCRRRTGRKNATMAPSSTSIQASRRLAKWNRSGVAQGRQVLQHVGRCLGHRATPSSKGEAWPSTPAIASEGTQLIDRGFDAHGNSSRTQGARGERRVSVCNGIRPGPAHQKGGRPAFRLWYQRSPDAGPSATPKRARACLAAVPSVARRLYDTADGSLRRGRPIGFWKGIVPAEMTRRSALGARACRQREAFVVAERLEGRLGELIGAALDAGPQCAPGPGDAAASPHSPRRPQPVLGPAPVLGVPATCVEEGLRLDPLRRVRRAPGPHSRRGRRR